MSEMKCKRCGADEKTDFTKEFIAEARESITEPGVERYICIPVQLEMLDEIERLQSRIAELEAERRWIPVGERLPKNLELVLAVADYEIVGLTRYLAGFGRENVTHWMPLPESPTDHLTADSTDERKDDKWIPVSERLPKDCELVWVRATNSPHNLPRRAFYTYRNGKWVNDEVDIDNVYSNLYVTHWMPLTVLSEVQE